MACDFETTNECELLEEKFQLRKVQLCDLHVVPITEIPRKLSDILSCLNLEEMYGNIKKVHIIVLNTM